MNPDNFTLFVRTFMTLYVPVVNTIRVPNFELRVEAVVFLGGVADVISITSRFQTPLFRRLEFPTPPQREG